MLIAFLFSSLVLWVTSHLLESHAYLSLSYLWKCRLGLSEKEKERPLTTSQRLREIERRREMNLGYRLTPGIYPSDASLSLLIIIRFHVQREDDERRERKREKERKSQWLTFPFPFVHHQPLDIF